MLRQSQMNPLNQQPLATNPSSYLAKGISQGFQRQDVTKNQPHMRDLLRISFASAAQQSTVTFEPIERAAIQNFRPSAVTCCLEMASVLRSSATTPVLIRLSAYQASSVAMSANGNGPSAQWDNVIGIVNPNTAYTLQPVPSSSGAQFMMNNLLHNQLTLTFTDTTGNPISDLTSFYVSLSFFERA